MPLYEFKCDGCGHVEDQVRTIEKRDVTAPCPICEVGVIRRDAVASMRTNTPNEEYDQPVYSQSLGVPPYQIAEAKARFPHHEYTPGGKLVIRSHHERQRVLKDLGYHNLRDS